MSDTPRTTDRDALADKQQAAVDAVGAERDPAAERCPACNGSGASIATQFKGTGRPGEGQVKPCPQCRPQPDAETPSPPCVCGDPKSAHGVRGCVDCMAAGRPSRCQGYEPQSVAAPQPDAEATPGPWHVDKRVEAPTVVDAKGRTIAFVRGGDTLADGWVERCWANAALIAQAPDLKAEVERLREAATELLETADLRGDANLPPPPDDPKVWTARMQAAWDDLRAALDAKP